MALVVAALMWRQLFTGDGLVLDDIFTSDLLNANAPARAFIGAELRHGRAPSWMPGMFGGLPAVAQGEAAATNPFTWIFYGLFDWVTATTLSVALHTWIAGFGMLGLARRWGASLPGALVGAISFMLCGFMVGHVKHMNLHHAAAWLPSVVWAADRMLTRPRAGTALAFGVVAALQLTEGHPQISYITALPLLALALIRVAQLRADPQRCIARLAAAVALSCAVVAVLAGAYLVAGYEMMQLSERTGDHDRWAYATRFAFFADSVRTLYAAHVFGDGANATYDPRYGLFWESWLYVGVIPFSAAAGAALAAFAGRFPARRRHTIAAVVTVAAIAFVLMPGAKSPAYAAAFDLVPGMALFRFPQRFGLVLEASIALLAALGASALCAWVRRGDGRVAGAGLAVALVLGTGGDMIHVMARHFPAAPRQALLAAPSSARFLEEQSAAPERMVSVHAAPAHAAAFDIAKGWSGDLSPYLHHRVLLQAATHLSWNLESISGYTSLVPEDVGRIVGTHTIPGYLDSGITHIARAPADCPGPPRYTGPCRARLDCSDAFARALGAFNVRHLVSPLPLRRCQGFAAAARFEAGPFEAFVYENVEARPRAYLVDHVIDVPDAAAAGRTLVGSAFDPQHDVVRTRPGAPPPPLRTGSVADSRGRVTRAITGLRFGRRAAVERRPPRDRGDCRYQRAEPGRAEVRCDVREDGVLVIADGLYPGTVVELDGRRADPFVANGFVIGLPISAGDHHIVVRYAPWHAPLFWIGAIGWLAALAWALTARRRAFA